ncbi:hypothetical+protein [Methylocapsa aurea]|uniref:hypothetical protein n=1 Tax=Methylocapsa aurea TaxID=663610 RepID=UPI003D1886F1
MRRIVRPFVKEFKSRSAKAAAGRLPLLEETTAAEPKPAFLDLASFAPRVVERETHHDDTYEAAMKAADLVFGKKIEPAADAPLATTGRVLPSLVETAAPQPELLEEPVRRKRGRPPGVKKAAEPVSEAEAPIRRPRRAPKEAAPVSAPALALAPALAPAPAPRRSPAPSPVAVMAQPSVPVAVAAEVATTSRRVRRSIQLRWVLGTELQAGERWKRRLPQAAR